MEDTQPDLRRLEDWARMLGAHQEARRVHATEVGTAHLLMSTYADPEVRRRLGDMGADMGEVQARVGDPVALMGTIGTRPGRPSAVTLSEGAVRVLDVLLARVADDPVLAGRADPRRDRNPRIMSALLRLLLIGLLRDPVRSTARRILDDLTGGRIDPNGPQGAWLITDLLGDAPQVPGRAVPLSRPALD